MRKKIYRSVMGWSLFCILLTSFLLGFVFYKQLTYATQNEIRKTAQLFIESTTDSALEVLRNASDALRITLVAPDGEVIYESTRHPLENHAQREEIQEAMEKGYGEGQRHSSTLGEETYYYAVKLQDGNILRIAKTIRSMENIFRSSLPSVLLAMTASIVLSYFAAKQLTDRIVEPINEIRLGESLSVPYDELAPFAKTVALQRKHIENQWIEIKERTDTISAMMDGMREGLFLTDKKGFIIAVNASARKEFDVKEFERKNILEIFRDIVFIKKVESALGGIPAEMDLNYAERVYRVLFSPIQEQGMMILFSDITERCDAEKHRREFSANVSHELKTPLTSIYGNIEMLKNNMVAPGDEAIFYEKIQNETKRMIAMVQDILLLSRLDEADTHRSEQEKLNLRTIAEEVAAALDERAREKQVVVSIQGDEAIFYADRTQMYALLHNLIDNAVLYNRPGGKVEVNLLSVEDEIKIRVSDNGIGISKEEQDRVFERFYRVEKSRAKSTGGTGLGLAIVKHIVKNHDGTITLDSVPGEGTSIEIVFSQNRCKKM